MYTYFMRVYMHIFVVLSYIHMIIYIHYSDQARASLAQWLTELYYGIVSWNYITELCYRMILQNYITELGYGDI